MFFDPRDYQTYRTLLTTFCQQYGVEILCYCLMPNHVHLIVVPSSPKSLTRAMSRTHEAYSRIINARNGWRGYLWQGRYSSFPLSDSHLIAAARYVLLNPVRAKLVRRSNAWRWSSAQAHLSGKSDGIVNSTAWSGRISSWRELLGESVDQDDIRAFRAHARTGRPLGDEDFIARLEAETGRRLKLKRRETNGAAGGRSR